MALVVTDTADLFSDAELTSLATEIIHDVSSKQTEIQIDSTNESFISELAEEIEKESAADVLCSIIMNKQMFPDYKIQSSYELSRNDSFNITLPKIPSIPYGLSRNDSFNISLPRIPSIPSKSAPVPQGGHRFKSPMYPPPRHFAVASASLPKSSSAPGTPSDEPELELFHISRSRGNTKQKKVSTVPDFMHMDCTHVIITKFPKNSQLKKKRKAKKKSVGKRIGSLDIYKQEIYKQKKQHMMNMQ